MPSVALVPIRGITLSDIAPETDLGLPWNILSVEQARLLVGSYDPMGSLPGNFNMIEARLSPNAYLLIRCEQPDSPGSLKAYDYAETIIAALSITSLLVADYWQDPWEQQPMPLYRARFKEACDLPLVFDETRIRLVGHSSWFSWLSPDGQGLRQRIPKQRLLAAAAAAPSIVQQILSCRGATNEAEHLLISSLRAMHAGLQATTPGQLTANLVSAVELLVSAQDREPWFRRKARLKVLLGATYWSRCEDVLWTRHAFVHESTQPVESFMGHCALALFVQAWSVFSELLSICRSQQRALEFLDHLLAANPPRDRRTSDLSPEEMRQFARLYEQVPGGPVVRLKWVHQYLVDSHPNDYHRRFVVAGRISCQGERCGHMLHPAHVIAREHGYQVYICPFCNFVSRAELAPARIADTAN